MLVVQVNIVVKPELVESFLAATLENARHSAQEPGIARFDVLRSNSDPARFILTEVYRNPAAPAAHRATEHYMKWRDAAAEMMAEPRVRGEFTNVFPDDEGW